MSVVAALRSSRLAIYKSRPRDDVDLDQNRSGPHCPFKPGADLRSPFGLAGVSGLGGAGKRLTARKSI